MKDDFQPVAPAQPRPLETNTAPPNTLVDSDSRKTGESKGERSQVRLHRRIHWWLKSLTPKQLILLGAAVILLLTGAYLGLRALARPQVKVADSIDVIDEVPEEPATPTKVASRMTGLLVSPELNKLPVTGVMIENSPDARPQSGLRQADMVIEAIAEGGITRFLALYQESQPGHIGPVRSVRPYYLDFLVSYDGAIVHAGGSGKALSQIRRQNIKDIDHGANGSTFQRVSNRYAPHNLFTSRSKLLAVHKKRGYTKSSYEGLVRKENEEPAEEPTAKKINLTISSFLYNPSFSYDTKTNSYTRSQAGKPHVDERSGKPIVSKVLVVLVMSHRYDGIYSVYKTTGSGTAYVFQDGVVTKGKWAKSSRKDELKLTDADGEPLALNPGRTWISLVSTASAVSYKP